jgi:hypothetical protein
VEEQEEEVMPVATATVGIGTEDDAETILIDEGDPDESSMTDEVGTETLETHIITIPIHQVDIHG